MNVSSTNLYIISNKGISPQYFIALYCIFCTRGYIVGGVVSESLFLLLILSIKYFSRSGLRVMSLGVIWYLPSTSGTSTISILTLSTLLLHLSALICLYLYIIFLLRVGHETLLIPSYYLFPLCLWIVPLYGWTLR